MQTWIAGGGAAATERRGDLKVRRHDADDGERLAVDTISRPTSVGSAPKRRRQKPSLITTTCGVPAASAVRKRAARNRACTPSTSKNSRSPSAPADLLGHAVGPDASFVAAREAPPSRRSVRFVLGSTRGTRAVKPCDVKPLGRRSHTITSRSAGR